MGRACSRQAASVRPSPGRREALGGRRGVGPSASDAAFGREGVAGGSGGVHRVAEAGAGWLLAAAEIAAGQALPPTRRAAAPTAWVLVLEAEGGVVDGATARLPPRCLVTGGRLVPARAPAAAPATSPAAATVLGGDSTPGHMPHCAARRPAAAQRSRQPADSRAHPDEPAGPSPQRMGQHCAPWLTRPVVVVVSGCQPKHRQAIDPGAGDSVIGEQGRARCRLPLAAFASG